MRSTIVSAQEFDLVATTLCKRWREKSLRVARALLVSGDSLSEVAKREDVSPQHANVLRTRFLERFRDASSVKGRPVEEFLKTVKPDLPPPRPLHEFQQALKDMLRLGYSRGQIEQMLAEQNASYRKAELTQFIEENR